jgi:hypothetical protein
MKLIIFLFFIVSLLAGCVLSERKNVSWLRPVPSLRDAGVLIKTGYVSTAYPVSDELRALESKRLSSVDYIEITPSEFKALSGGVSPTNDKCYLIRGVSISPNGLFSIYQIGGRVLILNWGLGRASQIRNIPVLVSLPSPVSELYLDCGVTN